MQGRAGRNNRAGTTRLCCRS